MDIAMPQKWPHHHPRTLLPHPLGQRSKRLSYLYQLHAHALAPTPPTHTLPHPLVGMEVEAVVSVL